MRLSRRFLAIVGAADPPPHGIRRSAPAADAAPLENDKSVIKEKADVWLRYVIVTSECKLVKKFIHIMDKRRKRVKGAVRRQGEARPLTLREPTRLLSG